MTGEEGAAGTASAAMKRQAMEASLREAEKSLGEAEASLRVAAFYANHPERFKETVKLLLLDCVRALSAVAGAAEGAEKDRAIARIGACGRALDSLESL